jgi:HPt (histidine-containing phosphotransfer) domain-containing protein
MNSLTFEREMLYRFYGNCPNDVSEILTEYVEDEHNMISSLQNSFQNSVEALRDKVHHYASIFTYVGFPQISFYCIEFEKKCKQLNNLNALELNFTELINYILHSIQLAKNELEEIRSKTNFLGKQNAA